MTGQIVVTGTGTGIGKTVFCAGLAHLLDAHYWKPIQSGLDGETDSETVARLGGICQQRIVPERYLLRTPASPHHSARIDGVRISLDCLSLPAAGMRPLVIEGAGGLMVPLTEGLLYIDVFARWRCPVVLCARTELGTINHSLLSISALRAYRLDILGVAFVGDENVVSEQAICEIGQVRSLGRLPLLSPLEPEVLRLAFGKAFERSNFL